MKRIWILFLVAALAVSVMACGKTEDVPSGSAEQTQMANPWTDHESLDAACEAADMDLAVPDTFFSEDTVLYRTLDQDIVEVQYVSAEEETLTIRKGATEADISGDSTVYDYAGEVTVSDIPVTVKGMNDAELFAASWVQDGHFYYVVSTIVIPADAMLDTIGQIIALNAD